MPDEPGAMMLTDEDRRPIALWAADSAERVLPLFEAKAPSDARPREAIEAARAFGHGGKRTAQLRTVAMAAHAAAREAGDPAAAAAARAAGTAAATGYMHERYTPGQEKHLLGTAVYAALARELAGNGDPGGADEELSWATEHAAPVIREVVRQMPPRSLGRSRLDALYHQLDARLRS